MNGRVTFIVIINVARSSLPDTSAYIRGHTSLKYNWHKLTPWSSVLEKLLVTQLPNKYSTSYEPKVSLPCLPELAPSVLMKQTDTRTVTETICVRKMAVFCNAEPCSFVEVFLHFRSSVACLHHEGSSLWRCRQSTPHKLQQHSAILHGATSQKTVIFMLYAVRTWKLSDLPWLREGTTLFKHVGEV